MSENTLLEWLEEKVQSFMKDTIDSIVGEYQRSKETNKDYSGRQLLELLQNSYDAHDKDEDIHKVYIELTDTQLVIKNTGIGFSKEGVRSLLTSNLSPKGNNSIGNKGLGFRSILNWANKIHIQSDSAEEEGLWSFGFSREYAKERFNKLPKDKQKQAREIVQGNKKYPIATLRCPKWDKSIKKDSDYTTIITLNLKEGVSNEIKEQFNKINENTLVFLPKLSEIEIVFNNKNIIYKKDINNRKDAIDKIIIEKHADGNHTSQQWTIHNEKGKIDEKDYHLAIAYQDNPTNAYQDDLSNNANCLFSFFLTEVPFEIPALVHGTFDLEGNRKHISNIDLNKKLLKKLSDLLIKSALYISDSENTASWTPLSLIYFDKNRYDTGLQNLGFYDYHLKQIGDSKLFPCHDGKYRTIKKILLFRKDFRLHRYIHDILEYKKFNILEDLLLYTKNKRCFQLICMWNEDFNDAVNLITNQINSISHKLSEDERVKIIHFISKYTELHFDKKLNLLVDKDNNVIEHHIDAYIPTTTGGINFEIPQHVNLNFISETLYEKLITKFSQGGEYSYHKLQDTLKEFLNIHTYEPAPVIKKIISETSNTNLDQIKEMIKSLYSAFINNEKEYIPFNFEGELPLVNKQQQPMNSKDLYLGTPYEHGKLIENIYKEIDINYLATPKDLGLLDKVQLEPFFKWLGVNEFYKLKDINIQNDASHQYIKWFQKQTRYNFTNGYTNFSVTAISCKYISEVFCNNSIESILCFLKLSNVLEGIRTKQMIFYANPSRTSHYIIDDSDKYYYSYFQWELKNSISNVSGSKSSPKSCILPNLNLNLSPILETVNIDYKKLELYEGLDDYKVEEHEAIELLHKIGVYKEFNDIGDKKIKDILINLHKYDKEGNQAKKIYRLILKKYTDDKKLQCGNMYVYCKKDKEKSYFLSNDSYYINELIYPKAILKKYPLIEIDLRQGQSKIEHIFNVKPLKNLEISLDINNSKENNLNIQDDIDRVKPYILALRLKQLEYEEQNKIYQSIRDMKVQLMSTLAVKLDGETSILDEFDYIYDKNTFYLSAKSKDLHELRNNLNYIDIVPVLFSAALKVTTDKSKYKEIYKDNSENNRKHILNTYTQGESEIYLEKAKELLNTNSPRSEFWNNIAALKEIDERFTNDIDDKSINNIFELNIDINTIDYKNISAKNNYKILKSIFTGLQIKLERFNKISTSKINFNYYFQQKLSSKLAEYKEKYKSYIWNELNSNEVNNQEELGQRWNRYEDIKFTDIRNDFEFNIEEYLSNCLYEKTKVSLNELSKFQNIDFHKEYFKFRKDKDENLLGLLWEKNEENLSYFKNYHEELNKQYGLLKGKEVKQNNNRNKVVPSKIRAICREVKICLPPDSENTNKPLDKRKISTSYNRNRQENNWKKLITGRKGEEIVFKHLKEKFSNSPNWVSKYAKEAGVNADGRDGQGYDITYWNDEGTQFFVEVKSTTNAHFNENSISFYMTSNEYEVAKEKGENYQIFYVSDVDNSIPEIKFFTFDDGSIKKVPQKYEITTDIKDLKDSP